jgi:hypothetical protein
VEEIIKRVVCVRAYIHLFICRIVAKEENMSMRHRKFKWRKIKSQLIALIKMAKIHAHEIQVFFKSFEFSIFQALKNFHISHFHQRQRESEPHFRMQ